MLVVIAWLWSILAGASVALTVGGNLVLNDTPTDKLLHSLYVSSLNIGIGAVWLSGVSLVLPAQKAKMPTKKWSMCGGLVIAPAFVTTPAADKIGIQMVLMLLLVGMVGAALLFDCMSKQLVLRIPHVAGLVCLIIGVVLELIDAPPKATEVVPVVGFSIACVVVGFLYGAQSKMNNALAQDLGSAARAAAFCSLSCLIWGVPLWCILAWEMDVQVHLRLGDWWIWALTSAQSGFYTLSLAVLPKVVGYSVVFILMLAGKLATAAVVDVTGVFTGDPQKLSVWRVASLVCILVGAALYTVAPKAHQVREASVQDVERSSIFLEQPEAALETPAEVRLTSGTSSATGSTQLIARKDDKILPSRSVSTPPPEELSRCSAEAVEAATNCKSA